VADLLVGLFATSWQGHFPPAAPRSLASSAGHGETGGPL